MAIRVHCPACHEYLEKMSEVCPHCDAALPPGVVMSLAAANGTPPSETFLNKMSHVPDELIPVAEMTDTLTTTTAVPHHYGEMPQSPTESSGLRPWLAAALSLCCGLGQLYNGQILKGIVLMILGAVAILNWPSLASKVAIPVLWGFAIVDAFRQARRMHH